MTSETTESPCPCGSGSSYAGCCGTMHRGVRTARTAEELMRSRFSAFATQDAPYLLETWHPSTRPATVSFDPALEWRRLRISDARDDGEASATVEFTAHFWDANRREYGRQHEISRFVREDGRWFYVDGQL